MVVAEKRDKMPSNPNADEVRSERPAAGGFGVTRFEELEEVVVVAAIVGEPPTRRLPPTVVYKTKKNG